MANGKKKIMYVEDDPDLLQLLSLKLSQTGFVVVQCETGGQALGLAKTEKPDVILLDIMLPDIDGVTVLQQLSTTPETKAIPVIIMSNLGSKDSFEQVAAIGDYEYLVKATTDFNTVIQKINGLLKK